MVIIEGRARRTQIIVLRCIAAVGMGFGLLDLAWDGSKYEVVVEEYVWGVIVEDWLFEGVLEGVQQKT